MESAPSNRTLVTLLLTLWEITHSGVRVFFWDSLRQGAIDLRPLGRALRVLAVIGLALVIAFLISILVADVMRQSGPLELVPNEADGRGLHIPPVMIPLTFAALTLGWCYVLLGALHARPAIRWPALLAYFLFGVSSLLAGFIQPVGIQTLLYTLLAGILLLALVIGHLLAFILLPRVKLPLAVEFAIMLVLVGGIFLMSYYFAVQGEYLSTQPFSGYLVGDMVQMGLVVTIPFLFVAGIEMVNFGLDASGWVAKSVHRHAAGWIVGLLLVLFLALRLIVFGSSVSSGVSSLQWGRWGTAAIIALGFIPILFWRRGQPADDHVPYRLVLALVVGLQLFQILLIPLMIPLGVLYVIVQGNVSPLEAISQPLNWVLNSSDVYHEIYPLLLALSGAVVALIALRRKRPTIAAFGLILAWTEFWAWLMMDGHPLEAWRYNYQDLDAVLLIGLCALALYLLVRRQLTRDRALRLLAVGVLAALLNSTGFLSNPFTPLFSFAGVFFLVFGILWSVLTAGSKFINTGTPGLPRASRLLLYLGYVLLSVAVAHWYIVSHDTANQVLQNDFTIDGFRIFGLALAYLVIVERGEPLLKSE